MLRTIPQNLKFHREKLSIKKMKTKKQQPKGLQKGLFCSVLHWAASSWVLCVGFGAPQYKKNIKLLEGVQGRATKMLKVLKGEVWKNAKNEKIFFILDRKTWVQSQWSEWKLWIKFRMNKFTISSNSNNLNKSELSLVFFLH